MAMDESQVKRIMLANKLTAGKATQEERDEAMSIMLLSIWSDTDLVKTIENNHNRLCADCPVKQRYEHEKMEAELDAEVEKKAYRHKKRGESGNGIFDLKSPLWKILIIGAIALSTALSIIANLTKTQTPSIPAL